MNDRDFHYIESRLYGDPQVGECLTRLHDVGQHDLHERLLDATKRYQDNLRDIRITLMQRRNARANNWTGR